MSMKKIKIIAMLSLSLTSNCMNDLPDAQKFVPDINIYPPAIVPDGMVFQTTQKVVLKANPNNSTEAATGYIVYDLNGAAPSCDTSTQYSTPLTISTDTLLSARFCYETKLRSAVAKAFFLQLP